MLWGGVWGAQTGSSIARGQSRQGRARGGLAAEVQCPPGAEAREPALARAQKHSAASQLQRFRVLAISRVCGLAPLFCLTSTSLFILLGKEEEVKHPSPGSVVLAGQSRAPPAAVTALRGLWSGARERFPARLFCLCSCS